METFAAVGHLDADCFYVSAERVRFPDLIGKPVAVLGNQGACVIAKSYEMKRDGVKTGEPIWEALKKCPRGIYVKRDFRWYEVLSRKMLGIVSAFSPRVEYYSIDEFFFLARSGSETAQASAVTIRDRIQAEAGLPVTVGIARTRTLAKLIADASKPFGARAILDQAGAEELMARLPVTEIAGIAGRRAARLAAYGIRTCLDLARAKRSLVRQLLTAVGVQIWHELNGEPIHAIRPQRPPHQTLSRGGSLGGTVTDPVLLYAWAVRNLERLIGELEYHQVRAGRLTLFLNYRDAPSGAGEVSLEVPTDQFDLLLDATRLALRQAWRPRAAATHMHLIASHLRYGKLMQRGLFDPPAEQAEAVARLKRATNERFGSTALRSAATLFLKEVYRDPINAFDICDVRGKMCF